MVTFILVIILASSQITIGEMYTENRINPIGHDTQNPRFLWVINSDGRQVLQSAYVLALQFDLLPEKMREQAVSRLVKNIREYGHITTGFLGTPYINHVLTRFGQIDVANVEINIPVNTSARVYVPASPTDDITEGGKGITGSETIDFVEIKDDYVLLILGSGKYNFTVSEHKPRDE